MLSDQYKSVYLQLIRKCNHFAYKACTKYNLHIICLYTLEFNDSARLND